MTPALAVYNNGGSRTIANSSDSLSVAVGECGRSNRSWHSSSGCDGGTTARGVKRCQNNEQPRRGSSSGRCAVGGRASHCVMGAMVVVLEVVVTVGVAAVIG